MNIDLMEKIAKRKEDPNYPYGNKLPLDRKGAIKAGIKGGLQGAIKGGAKCGLTGGLISIAINRDIPIKKTVLPLTTSLATLGAIKQGKKDFKEHKKQYEDKDRDNKALSYLSSGEQKDLIKKYRNLSNKEDIIWGKIDSMEKRIPQFDNSIEEDKWLAKHKNLYDLIDSIELKQSDLHYNAKKHGKALMLAEKNNRRLFKKASEYLDDAVMEKEARAKIEYVAMGKNSDGEDCMRTVRLTRAEAKKFMKNKKLPVGNLVINRRNKKVYLVDDNGKRAKRPIGVMTSERAV